MGTRFWRFSVLIIKRIPYRLLRQYILAGLLGLSLAFASQARAGTVLVVGDSISAAYGMSLEQGWVALLASHLDGHSVVNASISGDTTSGALRRLPTLLQEHKPSVVILELGGNDGLRGYPINQFRDNLLKLVTLSTEAGARVVLLPMEIPPNYGTRYTGSFRASYPLVAEQTEAALGPFILDGIATNPALMQADGIHPRAEAQPMMLANVQTVIEAALEDS
jgi:acyl-CoA thioesterase-1